MAVIISATFWTLIYQRMLARDPVEAAEQARGGRALEVPSAREPHVDELRTVGLLIAFQSLGVAKKRNEKATGT